MKKIYKFVICFEKVCLGEEISDIFFLSEIFVYPQFCILNLGYFLKVQILFKFWLENRGGYGQFWLKIQKIYFEFRNFCLSQKLRILAKMSQKIFNF